MSGVVALEWCAKRIRDGFYIAAATWHVVVGHLTEMRRGTYESSDYVDATEHLDPEEQK